MISSEHGEGVASLLNDTPSFPRALCQLRRRRSQRRERSDLVVLVAKIYDRLGHVQFNAFNISLAHPVFLIVSIMYTCCSSLLLSSA